MNKDTYTVVLHTDSKALPDAEWEITFEASRASDGTFDLSPEYISAVRTNASPLEDRLFDLLALRYDVADGEYCTEDEREAYEQYFDEVYEAYSEWMYTVECQEHIAAIRDKRNEQSYIDQWT